MNRGKRIRIGLAAVGAAAVSACSILAYGWDGSGESRPKEETDWLCWKAPVPHRADYRQEMRLMDGTEQRLHPEASLRVRYGVARPGRRLPFLL